MIYQQTTMEPLPLRSHQ